MGVPKRPLKIWSAARVTMIAEGTHVKAMEHSITPMATPIISLVATSDAQANWRLSTA